MMECHVVFTLPLPKVQIENSVCFTGNQRCLKAALLILADLTYALTFSAALLRCNTAKTLQQLSVKHLFF